MRIASKSYEFRPPPREIGGPGTAAADSSRADVGPKPTGGELKVDVSPEARRLAASGGLDAAKVERLRAAIEAGSFVVDSAAVAQKLVDTGG